jgi:hypothetical protein
VDFSSFQCVSFRCKWQDTFKSSNVKENHDSWLIGINSENMWNENKEPCVFRKHYNQVFFYQGVLDMDWWFILTHDLRLNIFLRTTMLSCQVRKIMRVMEMNSNIYLFYFNNYIVDVSFYYGYL